MQMTIRFTVFFTEKYKETEYNFENSVTLPDLNELAMKTMLSAVDFKNNHLFHNMGIAEDCFVDSKEDFDEEDYFDDSEEDFDDEDYFDDSEEDFDGEDYFDDSEEDFDDEDYFDDSEEDFHDDDYLYYSEENFDDEEEDYFDDDDRSFNIMNLQWQIPPKKF